MCDVITREMLGGQTPDDVAVLAIRPVSLLAQPLRLTVPADATSVSFVRHTLTRYLREARAADTDVFDIVVAVSEACSNAAEHAYGPQAGVIQVNAEMSGAWINITIEDQGTWREPRGRDRGRGLSIMATLMDVVNVYKRPVGTQIELRKRITQEDASTDERSRSART